jgi:hypothetical protein
MLSIYDAASAAAALAQPLDSALRKFVTDRLHDAETTGLADLTHILVITPGTTERMIQEEIGWSPLVHPVDGVRFGTEGFLPYWSWLEGLGGWFELIHSVGNNFAYILLIADEEGVLPDLLQLCRTSPGAS